MFSLVFSANPHRLIFLCHNMYLHTVGGGSAPSSHPLSQPSHILNILLSNSESSHSLLPAPCISWWLSFSPFTHVTVRPRPRQPMLRREQRKNEWTLSQFLIILDSGSIRGTIPHPHDTDRSVLDISSLHGDFIHLFFLFCNLIISSLSLDAIKITLPCVCHQY